VREVIGNNRDGDFRRRTLSLMPTLLTFFLLASTVALNAAVDASDGAAVDASDRAPWTIAALDASGREATFTVAGGRITVVLPAARLAVTQAEVLAWVGEAASGVATYFGQFPVSRLRVEISVRGTGVNSGVTFQGRFIRIGLGQHATAADLASDWVMTHEMVHLAFPNLDARSLWMEEGLATYLEPVIRVRAGSLSASTMWHELMVGLPKGQPGRSRAGLDDDDAWGRTYWGGAGYWLLADLRIREQTAGRHNLDDVLRAVLAAGGDGSATWTVAQVLTLGRTVTGVDVLADLHRELGSAPVNVNYADWWMKLGLRQEAGGLVMDDTAPFAGMRRAIAGKADHHRQ